MRTTIDIDDPILKDLKELQRKEKKSLGRLASDLLASALRERQSARKKSSFRWVSNGMGARVDLADKDALYDAMERASPRGRK